MDKDQRQQEWIARIADYKASGLTMAAWCEARQHSVHQLKYWLRKLNPRKVSTLSTTSSSWLPVSFEPSGHEPDLPILVRIGRVGIEVRPGFNSELLRQVVQSLDSSC